MNDVLPLFFSRILQINSPTQSPRLTEFTVASFGARICMNVFLILVLFGGSPRT